MTDSLTGLAQRAQPTPVDLAAIDRRHPDHEDTLHLLGTTVAETAAGVTGVHHLGGLAARTLDRARRQVLGSSSAPGVNVAREDGTTVIDLDIVVEYPHAVSDVIDATRIQVSRAAAQIVTGPVVVDITVTDVHGPFDRDPAILDAIDTAGDKARDLKDRAVDKAGDLKDQAAGVVATASDKADELSERAADGIDDLKDRAGDLAATASDKADELKKQAADAVGDLTEQAGDVAEQAKTRSGELREDAADATERAGDAVSDFAARAIDKVADFQERAQTKVDEAAAEVDAPDSALGRQVDELEDHAESKLDELGAVAEEKLDELDRAADHGDAAKTRPVAGEDS
ncbi:Asp23/Gls24 family envelope stress response protein [Frondihabitans cladoniiphilus]|uniref:Alkaline shock family protein YloU n=1 Tax=Frondihabitans cladoniiphilus TaxID=715785 RepID=A0ABP8VMS7_9MICO